MSVRGCFNSDHPWLYIHTYLVRLKRMRGYQAASQVDTQSFLSSLCNANKPCQTCALPTEYVAAKVFLDDEHTAPAYTAAHDNNAYTLGRIGKHNVVIAVLPSGEYGTASAAGVARDMLHSFPNVRLGLMVGIGGGAPSSKHDIRLGDVVVSEPRNGLGGVFQYDFGKNIQDQPFQSTRFLAPPPQVLLTAMSELKATYTIDGHDIEQDIKNCLLRNERLRKRFGRPEAETDRLYCSHIIHATGEASCSVACSIDTASVMIRRVRDDRDDDPTIHYGVIASANQLMKDAKIRDQFADERGVLCFEIEAGGLMNQFPCLVVRGICDYSDTHKNKEWQADSPKKVEAEKKISELLESVHATVQNTRSIVATLKSNLDAKGSIEILNWLTRSDYGDQQSDFLSRRQPGTGQWLLHSLEYNAWLREDGQTLFCQGIPGAGKTILTSIVIEDLFCRFRGSANIGIAYIYCDFRRTDGQRAGELLASLLKQLAGCWSAMPEIVKALYDSHKSNNTRPSIEELSRTLKSVASLFSRVFIIVDALDECPGTRDHRSRFLEEVSKLQTKTQSNRFATSRYVPEVESELELTMHLEIRATKDDVRKYLNHHMMPQRAVLRENKQLQEDIKREIVEIVDGMFLLAQLHLQSFMAKTTEYDIRSGLRALRTGSNTYDEAYDEAMIRITGQDSAGRVLAEQALSWIVCAKRPLTVSELRHALAVKVDEDQLDKTRQPHIKDVISICAGLVTVDENKGTVRVVHYTAQQYLERTQRKWFPDAEKDIATKCVTYLSYGVFASGFCRTDAEFEERLRVNCLYDYAARNWGKHACGASPCSVQPTIRFLRNTDNVSSASQALMASPGYGVGYSQRVPRQQSGIHLVAMLGLDFVLAAVVQENNPNAKDTYLRTPLSWAADNGHEAVVKQPLEMGAPPDGRSKYERTPLSYAAASGRDCVIGILLTRKEVDVNSMSLSKRTPLSYAAENGHEEYGQAALSWAAANGHANVVKLLIAEAGVQLSSTSNSGQTPFSHAAANGHEAVITLLAANKQIDVNSKSYSGQTPLSWAVRNGREEVVKLLLLYTTVNVNSKDHKDYTPLLRAVRGDKEAMIVLLLADRRVETNAKDRDGMTPLSWAATSGKTAIVKLLLGNEAVDVDFKDSAGDTLLLWAVKNQKDSLAQLLLADKRVNADCKDASGRTPLSWAVTTNQPTIARLLLGNVSVDVNSKDKRGRTSLSWAVAQPPSASAFGDSKTEVIDFLLANETVDINLQDHNGLTPLLWAASYNRWTAMKKLLAREDLVDMNARYHDGRTTLSMAAETGPKSIVEQLVAKDAAGVNSEDDDGQTPLSWSAASLNWTVVQILLGRDDLLNVDVRHKGGRTPLSFAAADGQEEIVKLLLAQPAVDVNSKDNHGRTPLSFAADNGKWAIVRLLLVYESLDLDVKQNGRTALSRAAEYGQADIVRLLLARGTVDINTKDEKGRTPLSFAAAKGQWTIVGMLLANDTTDANVRYGGRTPLSLAAEVGRVDILSLLLAKDMVDINSKDESGQTPLSWAAAHCDLESVSLLLRSNAVDVNVTNMEGKTPLSLAIEYDHNFWSLSFAMDSNQVEVIRLLLANDKINVNCKDREGQTPLSQAILGGKRTGVELLLEDNRVDVNARDKDGRTPLSLAPKPPKPCWASWHWSEGVESVDFVRLMLSARMVDVNAKDNNGRTPISWAAEHEAEGAVKLLLADPRVDVNSKDNNGHTALSWAIARTGRAALFLRQEHLWNRHSGFQAPTACGNDHAIVQVLVEDSRVKVDTKDNEGWTPLRWAVRSVLERARMLPKDTVVDQRDEMLLVEARPLSFDEKEHKARLGTVDILLQLLESRS